MKRLFILLALALAMTPWLVCAQSYPSKPIRLVVPYPPGGPLDIMARAIGQKLTEVWGQPVVVDNRAGAGESIAAELVARSVPDGYTLLICSANAMIFRPYLAKVVTYDVLKDFTAVTEVADAAATIVVNPSLPVNSFKELIDYAKANPGKLSYGTSGIGTSHHLSAELIRQLTGVEMVHCLLYTSPSPRD